jgi:hypothetical protein
VRYHKVFGIKKRVVRECDSRKKTFPVKYYKNTSTRASNMENYTIEELLEELHDEVLHDEEPEESGDSPPPAHLDADEIEEVIDTLTERLAALSQHDIDAYLEYFESDDDESRSSDLNGFDDFGSERENEVGAVVDNASH